MLLGGACKKIAELGGIPVTVSGPDGYVYDKDGIITDEKISYLLEMRASGRDRCEDYADKFGVPFYKGQKPWGVKVDVAMPCATQNEIGISEAKQIAANGIKYYIEVRICLQQRKLLTILWISTALLLLRLRLSMPAAYVFPVWK